MNNGEFKKEDKIEMNIPHKELNNEGKNHKNSNKLLILLVLLNVLLLGGMGYFLFEQITFKNAVEEDIRIIKNKVTEFEGLNNNLEKLNNNFQILDIINSNTRQIPDIMLSIEENKKILKNFDISKNISVNLDIEKQFDELEKSIKSDIENALKKYNLQGEFKSKIKMESASLEEIKSEINTVKISIKDLSKSIFKLNESLNNTSNNDLEKRLIVF
ncbi:hypothetical protein [Marinitoga lauensis]|uniref:hypothetical protein n=1 Tax=Marinitoga lauensis TaxID=2201189 RepID=UPI001012E8BF|nr:hypothetical protein [Marinitoga lauensis]